MVFDVFGRFPLAFGLVSYPPGPISESVFLWRVSVDRNPLVCSRVGLGIVDFEGPNSPLAPQNPLETVGGEAPHPFPWVLGAVWTPQIGDIRHEPKTNKVFWNSGFLHNSHAPRVGTRTEILGSALNQSIETAGRRSISLATGALIRVELRSGLG